jgi:shikimate kinase/3-dehydroquinate synthase
VSLFHQNGRGEGQANLVLTGFMGTGKTAVGRAVARRLDREFVDMDAEIEARAGKSIPRIFAEEGERAFRAMEAALCEELSAQQGLVLATGGGALVDVANRRAMMDSGTVVCLTCDPAEIVQRIGAGHTDRPLLALTDGQRLRAEVERLLAARRPAYAAIPWHVDTTGRTVDEVVERVLALAGAVTLTVHHPGGAYPIHVGHGLLDHAGGALRAAGAPQGGRVALVSNPVVAPLYAARVGAALRAAGFEPLACTVPDGEQHKTLATVAGLYEQFLAGGLDRGGTVLALGGGVTGDMAGFAAATYMRGVRLAQVPTTLLAMVDASVGGKTGVDLPQGKNLAGAFKQPAVVVVDPGVLATLPAEEVRSGMAEVLKHALLADPQLFAALKTRLPKSCEGSPQTSEVLARALRVKIDVVEEDPYEEGRRAVLNLGHTVGHALERLSDFRLRHGEAVGIGLVAAARIAARLGRAEPALVDDVEAALVAWGLPIRCPALEAGAIWAAMAYDKKRRGRALRWVLPRAIGQVEIADDVPREVVLAVLEGMGAEGRG